MSDDLFGHAAPVREEPRVFSVTEMTRAVRAVIEEGIGQVWVEGEVSNYRKQASGHQYFTLKDAASQLPCVSFARPGAWRKQAALADGMQVQVRGTMTVYEARGQYQLNVQLVQAAGAGLLQARFEALKRRLEAEGLFAAERKRPLPRFPRALGIVTSRTGAALRDMLNVLERRAPWVRVVVSPVRVQGEGAAEEVVRGIAELNRFAEFGLRPVDVIVVARGGGSVEDLWAFNEEVVARAIVASGIPVVSAIGHEIDFTIADFAADLRAPTPSAAAELVVPETTELLRRLGALAGQAQRAVSVALAQHRGRVALAARSALFREPEARLREAAQRVDLAGEAVRRALREQLRAARLRLGQSGALLRQHRPERALQGMNQQLAALQGRLAQAFTARVRQDGQRLERLAAMLRLLGPQATLARGYSLTTTDEGKILSSARQAREGMRLITRLHDGEVESTVNRTR